MQDSNDGQRYDNNKLGDVSGMSTERESGTASNKSRKEITGVVQNQKEVPAVINPEDEEYNMKHPRRGVALIFNHITFENMEPRIGSEKDAEVITKTFQNLGFETRIKNDLHYKEFLDVLEKTAKESHYDCDCLVVVVMSHGDPGSIYCYDKAYATEELWEPFTVENCPSLASKPKLFFIQACRGAQKDLGVKMQESSTGVDSASAWYTVPNNADILIANSTVEGYVAWRDKYTGSWFIQTLCEELDTHGRTRDLLTILTFVSRRVALGYQAHKAEEDIFKQIPAFSSMLTRRVIFR